MANLTDIITPSGLATAAQGGKADTALQNGSLYATAAQGTLAANAAPLASPTFTGTPAAPTATVGTDTTQIATTAFVLANGSAGVGSDVQTFTSSGTWTKPAGITWVLVEANAGGGGGGNATGGTDAGGGTGGEGICKLFLASDLSATETVTIGAGGAGGDNSVTEGGAAGGDTSFGSLLTAAGGPEGLGSNSQTQLPRSVQGGQSYTNTRVVLNMLVFPQAGYGNGSSAAGGATIHGGGGGGGARNGAGGVSEFGGNGGAGIFATSTKGEDGIAPSGGGGGSVNDGGGGDGAEGRIVVKSW
jgi:hypothetical protein